MPVIVVGADTPLGPSILAALLSRNREIRAFVSDPAVAARLRESGVRVAVGDVSDASHVAGASIGCFSAVLLTEAALDGRDHSFALGGDAVLTAWATALAEAAVTRAIWVGSAPPDLPATPEAAVVDIDNRSPTEIAASIAEIDDRRSLP